MTKVCFRTLSLASAIALAIASMSGPAIAQGRPDQPTTGPASAPTAGAPQQISAPTPLSMSPETSPQRAGSLQQGFGPMQGNPLLSAQPMQNGGKW